jgi:hypothetical protein
MTGRKHRELLEEHTLKDIPDKFVQRMMNCETLDNVTTVFEKLKKLESGAELPQDNGISGLA